jgi:hypothetical protein
MVTDRSCTVYLFVKGNGVFLLNCPQRLMAPANTIVADGHLICL